MTRNDLLLLLLVEVEEELRKENYDSSDDCNDESFQCSPHDDDDYDYILLLQVYPDDNMDVDIHQHSIDNPKSMADVSAVMMESAM